MLGCLNSKLSFVEPVLMPEPEHRLTRRLQGFFCAVCGVRWPCLAAQLIAIHALLNTTPRQALSVEEWHTYGKLVERV